MAKYEGKNLYIKINGEMIPLEDSKLEFNPDNDNPDKAVLIGLGDLSGSFDISIKDGYSIKDIIADMILWQRSDLN